MHHHVPNAPFSRFPQRPDQLLFQTVAGFAFPPEIRCPVLWKVNGQHLQSGADHIIKTMACVFSVRILPVDHDRVKACGLQSPKTVFLRKVCKTKGKIMPKNKHVMVLCSLFQQWRL